MSVNPNFGNATLSDGMMDMDRHIKRPILRAHKKRADTDVFVRKQLSFARAKTMLVHHRHRHGQKGRLHSLGSAAIFILSLLASRAASAGPPPLLPVGFKYELRPASGGGGGGVDLVWSPLAVESAPTTADVEPTEGGELNATTTTVEPETPTPPLPLPIRIGGSRPEFRFEDGSILGYPKERKGFTTPSWVLALPMTQDLQKKIAEKDGKTLQVWSSGRRLDAGGYVDQSSTNATEPPNAEFAPEVLRKAPTIPVDPAKLGKYMTRRDYYDLPGLSYSEFPVPMEVVAEVTYPQADSTSVSLPNAKAPLVLFLHGRHYTCYKGGPNGEIGGSWPCEAGYKPIPSHKGYRYVADALASQGYVVVSISANSINAQDDFAVDAGASARSILIRHHLALWAEWNASGGDPWTGLFRGKLDMTRVVLVGHSRGGEGVNRAAIDAKVSDPYKIVGLVSYGPTSFGRQVTPDIPSATILPTCDGDVSDLQGQAYVDSSRDIAYSTALRSAVIVLGANHNYFNTEWTPGLAAAPAFDDWYDDSDMVCGSRRGKYRITAREQQIVGAAYTAALVRLVTKQKASMLPLLDGSYVRPEAIGDVDVATHAVGGSGYRLIYRPDSPGTPVKGGGMKGGECLGYYPSQGNSPLPTCSNDFSSPHFLQRIYDQTHPPPKALRLLWTQQGASVRFPVALAMRDFSTVSFVDVRVANDPDRATGAMLELWVRDGNGRSAPLATSLPSIEGWPGRYDLNRIHARTLRGRLDSLTSAAVDLKDITDLLLITKSAKGKVYVLDVAASRRGTEPPAVLDLPVISAEKVIANETDGVVEVMVRITASRRLKTRGSVWVQSGGTGVRLKLAPGSSGVLAEVPISSIGDTVYSTDPSFVDVTVGALYGVVTGNYVGGAVFTDDEIKPNVTVAASTVTISEGQQLQWDLKLTSPMASFDMYCFAVPPNTTRTELSSRDVPTSWWEEEMYSAPPTVPVPLSEAGLYVYVRFTYGVGSASVVVPTSSDGISEDEEEVALECSDFGAGIVDGLVLTGIVQANRR